MISDLLASTRNYYRAPVESRRDAPRVDAHDQVRRLDQPRGQLRPDQRLRLRHK